MKTKIIATIGPRSEDAQQLSALINAGIDIARMNFSHCTYAEFRKRKKIIRAAAKKYKRSVALMQDLQGPRIRVGTMPEQGMDLEEGKRYTFYHAKSKRVPAGNRIPIDDPYLHADMRVGEPVHLANGDIELKVVRVSKGWITAKVTRGGILFSNKAVNVPETNLRRSGITKKDIADVRFALHEGVDYIALSFVKSAKDIITLRKIIGTKQPIRIIAKIERSVALKNIDPIIQASDGILIARGDLGIEVPLEELPIIQKNLVRHAHWHGKPAIIATQMLTSMIKQARPTRAEVSDIANAIFDGADAVMLSDETAAGDYPIHAVDVMKKIIVRTERYVNADNLLFFESSPRDL